MGVKPERSGGDHLRGSSRNLLCQLMARLGTLRPKEAKRAFSDFILIILKRPAFKYINVKSPKSFTVPLRSLKIINKELDQGCRLALIGWIKGVGLLSCSGPAI